MILDRASRGVDPLFDPERAKEIGLGWIGFFRRQVSFAHGRPAARTPEPLSRECAPADHRFVCQTRRHPVPDIRDRSMKRPRIPAICCVLFVVSGSVASCGKSSPTKEPAATPGKRRAKEPAGTSRVGEAAAGTTEPTAAAEKPRANETADTPETIEVTVKSTEEYEYRTGMGGDEQGASISTQARHFQKSEMVRGPATGFEPVYRYRAKKDYVGEDSVEIELSDHRIGSGPDDPGTTTKSRVVIQFTVVK